MMQVHLWHRRVLVVIVAVVVSLNGMIAHAASNFYTSNNIHTYDKSGTASLLCNAGGADSLTGNNNKEKVWNFLISKGLTPEQAAGVAGNLQVESGFVPDNQENGKRFIVDGSGLGGWGIAQWTNADERPGDRRDKLRDAVKAAGLPYTDAQTPADKIDALLLLELKFLWSEATSRGDIKHLQDDTRGLTGEAAIAAAATSWRQWFERPLNPYSSERTEAAKKIYNDLKGTVVSGGGAAGCNLSSVVDGFVYYSQYDPAWANAPYGLPSRGTTTIEAGGCGPTSMAMIISTLTGSAVTPKDVATFGGEYYLPGQGSSHALFAAAASHWSLTGRSISVTQSAVNDTLSRGGLVVSGGSGAYPYTAGHIIVIRGVTPEGKYLVGNPLPLAADQGKSSADTVKNTAWFNTAYTWGQVGVPSLGMVAITK